MNTTDSQAIMERAQVHPRRMAFLAMMVAVGGAGASDLPDYIGMAQMYGRNVESTLHTELMNDAGRRTMRQSLRTGENASSVVAEAWPANVTDANVRQHEFTIAELRAMLWSDSERARRLLDGTAITVRGKAQAHRRNRPGRLNLVDPGGGGFSVYIPNSDVLGTVREGTIIRVRGRANPQRASFLELHALELLADGTANASRTPTPASESHQTAPGSNDATQANYPALVFSPSPDAARKARVQLTEALAPTLTAGHSREDMLHVFEGGELQRAFANGLAGHGGSMNDLGDVFTGALVMSWQVANEQNPLDPDQQRGVAAIRAGVRRAFATSAWLTKLSNDDKQLLAESLVLGSTLIASRYRHGLDNGDRGTVTSAREDARTMIRAIAGFDPGAVRLTARGFE